jgi:hypothetical protein
MANFNILERYDVRFPGMADIIVAAYNEPEAIELAMKYRRMPERMRQDARIVYHAAL